MKYIRIDVSSHGVTRSLVVAFPNDLVHADVGDALVKVCNAAWPRSRAMVVSAGEATLCAHETFGRSESLGVAAKHGDAALLNASDYGAHITTTCFVNKKRKGART